MSRGDLEHTEEILYKQSRESLSGTDTFANPSAAIHHKTAWEHEELYTGEHKSSSSLSFKVFIFSSFLCVFAGAFLFYTLTVHPTTVDSKKIVLNVEADSFVEGGHEDTLKVSISNNNSIALTEAKLVLTYDKGGTITGEPDIVTLSKDVGEIVPLAVIKEEFPYTLFGSQNEKRLLTVRLDYKVKGSSAIFPKETSTEVVLSVPPLLVSLEGSENVVSGDQTEYTVVIKNGTSTTSPPAIFTLTAPAGFSLIKVSEPQIDKSLSWNILPLKSGEEKRFTFQGVFTGVVGEKATLKGTVGSRKDDTTSLGELFSFDTKVFQYMRPGLSAGISLETDRGASTLLRKGDKVTATVQYKNDGLSKISYVEYSIRLPESIDPRQIFVNQNGYYDAGTHTIIWSSDAYDRLLTLGSGQGGALSFVFVVPSDFKDTSLPLTLTSKGMDTSLGKVIEGSKDFSYLVSGGTAFNAVTLYQDSLRPNTGPFPPRVDMETTYTAVLTVSTQADLQNGKVVFTIPSLYVKYLDGVSASSTVVYDSKNKLITWNIGSLQKEQTAVARIKLVVKPSLIHLGTSPSVSSKIVFTAEDAVTKEKIQQVADPITTQVSDPGSDYGAGTVVK